MKILHTADWHLGAKTDKRDRIKEQQKVMSEICEIADSEDVDIVLVCGDAFHNSIPSSEAEDLFFETIDRLSSRGNRVVVVLAGNHDDPRRLEANTHFAKKHNIVLVGDMTPQVMYGVSDKVKIVGSGDASIQVQKLCENGEVEVCNLALLPYPMEYRLKEKSEAETQSGKIAEWAKRACSCFSKGAFNVFASHLMVVGASRSTDLENGHDMYVKVGDVSAIDLSILPEADYYAFGHLHTSQVMKGKYAYSGSPMRFSYGQKDSCVLVVTGDSTGLKDIKSYDLVSPVKMENVKAESIEDAEEKLAEFSDEDFVSLTFVQDSPLTHREITAIREKFPCVTEIKLLLTKIVEDDNKVIASRKELNLPELFKQFYRSKKLAEPSQDMLDLFVQVMEEEDNETD